MPSSDSQTQSGQRSHETPEVFRSVSAFLMEFANKAETIVPQPSEDRGDDEEPLEDSEDRGEDKEPLEDSEDRGEDKEPSEDSGDEEEGSEDSGDEEEGSEDSGDFSSTFGDSADYSSISEDSGDSNAGERLDELQVRVKEELLKDVFCEIVGNVLDKLPEDGKEAFLGSCFVELFPKLPRESQRAIECKVNSQLPWGRELPKHRLPQEAKAAMSSFSPPRLERNRVNLPKTVGNPGPATGSGPQQPATGSTA